MLRKFTACSPSDKDPLDTIGYGLDTTILPLRGKIHRHGSRMVWGITCLTIVPSPALCAGDIVGSTHFDFLVVHVVFVDVRGGRQPLCT